MSSNGKKREGLPPFGDEESRLKKEQVDRGRRNSVHEISGYRPLSPVVGASDMPTAAFAASAPNQPPTNTSWHHNLPGQLPLSNDLQSDIQEQREAADRLIGRVRSLSKSRERFHYRSTVPEFEPAMATSMSPSTSPRLPSPPPFPEVQIGSQSPSMNTSSAAAPAEAGESSRPNTGAADRIRPGTKAADMAAGPPLIPLEEVSSRTSSAVHEGLQLINTPRSTPPSHSKTTSKPSGTTTLPAPTKQPSRSRAKPPNRS